MQIKIISIPVYGGDSLNEEMNTFLRSKKVVQIEQHFNDGVNGGFWTFCVRYVEDYSSAPQNKNKNTVDYRELLDAETFAKFSEMRAIRKQIAESEGVAVYAIFTNEELAEMAKLPELTLTTMRQIKGIGEKVTGLPTV